MGKNIHREFSLNKAAPFLIVFAGLLSFGLTLNVGFLWDDHEMIVKNPIMKAPLGQAVSHAFSTDVFDGKGDAYYRPLQTMVNIIDYKLWKGNPIGFHLTNLLFHLAAALLLYFLFKKILNSTERAFVVAAAFAVHPIVVEQLLIVAGRAEIMAFTFGLACVLCGLMNKPRFLAWSVLFLIFACFSKESGIIAPFLLALIGMVWPKKRINTQLYWIYGALIVAYMVVRSMALQGSGWPELNVWSLLTFVFTQLPAILFEYLRILIFPLDLHSHRRMVFNPFMMVLGYVLIGFFFVLIFRNKSKMALFMGGWFFIGLLPKMPVLATNWLMLDHWVYPSGPAAFLGLGLLMEAIYKNNVLRKKIIGGLFFGFFIFWTMVSWANISNRNTDEKLYVWALKYPTSNVVRRNLGAVYYLKGEYKKARALLEENYSKNPNSVLEANTLALARWKTGDKDIAVSILNQWIDKRPTHWQSYTNRALMLRGDGGLKDVRLVLEEDPTHEEAMLIKGNLLLEMNRKREAIEAYEALVQEHPNNVSGLLTLGALLAEKKELTQAKELWERALLLDPSNEIAQHNLRHLSKH